MKKGYIIELTAIFNGVVVYLNQKGEIQAGPDIFVNQTPATNTAEKYLKEHPGSYCAYIKPVYYVPVAPKLIKT